MERNLARKIHANLPDPVLELIGRAGKAAQRQGRNIYLVGGIVRDLLIGRPGRDIDLAVEGSAPELAISISPRAGNKPVIHKRFGTATFKLDDYRVDLATCRSESYDYHGALPRVYPGDLKTDLFRRDFSVNAMAACIDPDRFGQLIDYYGGKKDLKDGLIRTLHDGSFKDDATRIMRALRYEQRLGFTLEARTQKMLLRDLDMLDTISGDRLRREIVLWLGESQPEKIIGRAYQLGVLAKLHCALGWNAKLEKALVAAREMARSSSLSHLYFALLVYCMDKKQLEEFLLRLNAHGGELYTSARQTLALKAELKHMDDTGLKPAEIYFKLKPFSLTAVRANMMLASSQVVRKHLRFYLDKLRLSKITLNGNDLVRMGIPRGKQMGVVLNKILEARLNGTVRTRDDELRLASKLAAHLNQG